MGFEIKWLMIGALSFNDTQHASSVYDVTRLKPSRHLVADITIPENKIWNFKSRMLVGTWNMRKHKPEKGQHKDEINFVDLLSINKFK